MNKQLKLAIKEVVYYTKILTKSRYSGVKAKAWAIISDFVRMRDFILYGTCVSCGKRITDYRNGDAGHYITMGGHGALIGFCTDNIHLQCKHCNQNSGADIGAEFEREIIRRGVDIKYLNILKNNSTKADDWFFLDLIIKTYKQFKDLKKKYPNFQYPDYL